MPSAGDSARIEEAAMESEEERNKRAVSAFFDAMNRGDSAFIVDSYAEDGEVVTMGNTLISGARGKAEIAQFAGGVLDAFPDGLAFTIHSMTAEDDRVAVEAESNGTHASGRPYNNHYHFLFRFRDGKVLRLSEYMDTELVTDVLCGGRRPEAD
jgi:hypothetical protein